MIRSIDTTEYIDAVLSLLDSGKADVPVPIKGSSMVPFLREGDTVFLNSLNTAPKRGDIVLFKRLDGTYVLHRIAKCLSDRNYLLLGDGQVTLEPVARENILAIATSAKRNQKLIGQKSLVWRFFKNVWLPLRKLRPIIGKFSAKHK